MNIKGMHHRAAEAAALLRALANQRRLMILCALTGGERSVGALERRIGISQSALSQHLAVLRQQGVVRTRRDGLTIYYALAGAEVEAILQTLSTLYCPVESSRSVESSSSVESSRSGLSPQSGPPESPGALSNR